MAGYITKQLPVLPPSSFQDAMSWTQPASLDDWLRRYVVELAYTAWDIEPFARQMGWLGAPFTWNAERRRHLRAELDSAFFHLYGIERDDVQHVMNSFWIVRDRDVRECGSYRTEEMILDAYDAMAEATRGGSFSSRLIPPPGDPAVAHPASPETDGRWVPWTKRG